MKYTDNINEIYFDGECWVCMDGYCILKDRVTNTPFYYCYMCGCSYQELKSEQYDIINFHVFAPNGIDVVTANDIKIHGLSYNYVDKYDDHYDGMLCELWVYTELKKGSFEKAYFICQDILDTWHRPPEIIKNVAQAISNGSRDFNVIWNKS